jgi:hypothetical protein
MDTSVSIGESCHMQSALDAVQSWAEENKMKLNAKMTEDICG